jgi:hypothetical protein
MTLDITQQERFAKLLDRQAAQFTLQTFDDDYTRKDRSLVRVIANGNVNDPVLAQLNELGAGIFVTINETDLKWRSNDNITRIRAVWQEDDDGFAGVFPIEPTAVVESSPGKYHRYWLVSDEWPADERGRGDFEGVMARMVEQYGCDPAAVDLSRVLRLPGYTNKKRKCVDDAPRSHEVRIFKVHPQLRRYTRAEILEAFPPAHKAKAPPIAPEFTPSSADETRIRDALFAVNADDRETWLRMGMAIKHELGEGGRALWDEWSSTSEKFDQRDQERTWSSFKRNGVSAGTIFHDARQAGWRDPQQEHYERVCEELGSKADQSSNEKPEHPDADSEFTADELSRMEFEPIKYVVPGFIAEGLTLFAGKPKMGKSWLLMHAAWSVARGDYTLGGLFCEQGDVFYAALEDNRRRLKSRMDKLFPDVPWPRRLTFKCSMPRLAEGGLDAIKECTREIAQLLHGRIVGVIVGLVLAVRHANHRQGVNDDEAAGARTS